MTTNGSSGRGRDAELRSFERNRFFHGKLITARDMQTEQEYHAERLNALNRLVLGDGIVRGLTVTGVEDDGEDIEVTIDPGFALDRAGRPIVVERTITSRLRAPTVDKIYVFVAHDEASKERVPVPKSGSSYEEDCTYNRIEETYDVYYRTEMPDRLESVPGVEFPSDDDAPLTELARRYHRNHLESDGQSADGDVDVFIGSFERQSGTWVEAPETDHRPYVYTNDMLYSALTSHVTDFDNPHEVTVEGVSQSVLDAIEKLESVDEFVGRLDELETRLDRVQTERTALEQYVMVETIEAKIDAFGHVNAEFGSGTADEIVERSWNALDETPAMDRTAYLEFVDTVIEWETGLVHELDGDATAERLERYSAAVTGLKTTREELGGEESIVELATAQKRVCKTANSLTQD